MSGIGAVDSRYRFIGEQVSPQEEAFSLLLAARIDGFRESFTRFARLDVFYLHVSDFAATYRVKHLLAARFIFLEAAAPTPRYSATDIGFLIKR